MHFTISDQMMSDFLSGLVAVLTLVAVGGTLSLILTRMAARFPFTRIALVIALTPISFMRFLENGNGPTLLLFSMIATLLGITIDGISHLLEPRVVHAPAENEPEQAEQEQPKTGMFVWEKAE